jgi:hypothetical protein
VLSLRGIRRLWTIRRGKKEKEYEENEKMEETDQKNKKNKKKGKAIKEKRKVVHFDDYCLLECDAV